MSDVDVRNLEMEIAKLHFGLMELNRKVEDLRLEVGDAKTVTAALNHLLDQWAGASRGGTQV